MTYLYRRVAESAETQRKTMETDICVDYCSRFGDGALGACSKHGSTTASVVRDRNDFSLKFVDVEKWFR